MPAAIDERQIGTDLVTGDVAAIDALLLDKGFTGSRLASAMTAAQIEVIIPPARAQPSTMPTTLQRLTAKLRNRVETSFNEITGQMEPAPPRRAHLRRAADQDRRHPCRTHCCSLSSLERAKAERQLT